MATMCSGPLMWRFPRPIHQHWYSVQSRHWRPVPITSPMASSKGRSISISLSSTAGTSRAAVADHRATDRPTVQIERGTIIPSTEQVNHLAEIINRHERGLILCGPNCPGGNFPARWRRLPKRPATRSWPTHSPACALVWPRRQGWSAVGTNPTCKGEKRRGPRRSCDPLWCRADHQVAQQLSQQQPTGPSHPHTRQWHLGG